MVDVFKSNFVEKKQAPSKELRVKSVPGRCAELDKETRFMEAESEPSVIADAVLVPAHNSGDLKASYGLKHFASIEILPTQVIKAPPLAELFAEGTEIYLPLLRGDDLNLSVTAAKKILGERMVATPHLAARSVSRCQPAR